VTAQSAAPFLTRARRIIETGLVWAACVPLILLTRPIVQPALLAIALLDIPLQMNVHVAYRPDPVEFGALGGFIVSPTTVAVLGLYASWLVTAAVRGAERPRLWLGSSGALLAYLGFAVISAITAYDSAMSFRELFLLLQMLLLYLYVIAFVRSSRNRHQAVCFVVLLLMVGLILESAVILGVRNNSEGFTVLGLIRVRGIGGRSVGGTVGLANATGAYISLLLAPALGLLLTRPAKAYRAIIGIGFSLGCVVLALTLSRGAWIAVFTSLSLFIVAAWRRGLITVGVPVLTAVGALTLGLLSYSAMAARISDDEGSAQSRMPLNVTALDMIKDHPVVGVGPNNYTVALKQYGAMYGYWGNWVYTVHNKYLLVWAETGAGGILAFVCFLLAAIRNGWRVWRTNDPLLSPVGLGVAVAIAGHMTHMFVDIFNDRASIQLLWTLAALSVALSSHPGAANRPPLTDSGRGRDANGRGWDLQAGRIRVRHAAFISH